MKAGNIKKGTYIKHQGKPYQVTETEFSFYGRGSAHMRVKLKSFDGDVTKNVTFKSGDSVEDLDVTNVELQFLYKDQNEAVFMNPQTYEQVQIPLELISGKADLLTPEIRAYVQLYEDKAVGVKLPPKVKLKVIDAPEATAGNRAKAAKKDVTLETGLTILAPLFIKEGDVLVVDTESGEYVSRSN